MSVDYEIRLYSAAGIQVCAPIYDFESLDYSRVVNGVGSMTLVLNETSVNYYQFMERDAQIEIYRRYSGGNFYLEGETVWLVRYYERQLMPKAPPILKIIAFDGNELLKRRSIIYAAGSTQATKTAALDNMMKSIMLENFGASAAGLRNISASLGIQANFTAAPSKTQSFQGKRVLELFQELAGLSYTAGTYLAFDVVAGTSSSTRWEFRTYTGARGVDHSYPNGIPPVQLDPALANLSEVVRATDFRDEVTNVIAGGQGTASDRMVFSSPDATRVTGPVSYYEKWLDARNNNDAIGTQADADAELRLSKVKRSFKGKLIETDNLLYGRDFKFGDIVSASYLGEQFNCRLDLIQVNFTRGVETLNATLQADS